MASILLLEMLSKKMMWKIKVNLALSMMLNITGVILAMFAVLNPISAALFHNVSSVFVVVNSALLLGWRSSFSDSRTEKAGIKSEKNISVSL